MTTCSCNFVINNYCDTFYYIMHVHYTLDLSHTVDREIFAFKYFRVINVRVSNFRHKVQEVKIIHGVFYFRVLNFRRPRERRKFFNGEYFPIYGII